MRIYVLTIHNPKLSFGPQLRLEGFLNSGAKHDMEFVLPKFCEPEKHSKLKTFLSLANSFNYLVKNHRKIDLIHVVTPPSYPGFLIAVLMKKLFKKKYIVDIGDPCAENQALIGSFSEKSTRFKLLKLIDQALYDNASHIILSSPEIAKYTPAKIPTSTILTGLKNKNDIQPTILPNNKNCLYIGNYGPLQNLDYLIKVFTKAINTDQSIQLHIVGNGEREKLEKLVTDLKVEKNIKFFDPIPSSKIQELAKKYVCGVVALNLNKSLDYAIPTKLLTSLTLGLPIFGTGGRATKNLVRKAGAGLISTKYNFESDYRALIHLLKSRETLKAYSENATFFAKHNLTFETCAKTYKLTLQ